MATPILEKHRLAGTLGDLLVDVRAPRDASPRPAVVVLHGFKGFKDWGMFPPFSERLARAGFTAVSYNSSGSGVDDEGRFAWPERFGRFTFSGEIADLSSVVSALVGGAFGPAPTAIGVLGHSRGGGVSILTIPELPVVRALATWSAIGTVDRWPETTRRIWRERGYLDVTNQRTGEVLPIYPDVLDDIEAHRARYDIVASAARITVPWLLVHAEDDETVPIAEGKTLAAAAPGAQSLIIERGGHTFGATHPLSGRPASMERVFDATIAHFARSLG